MEASQNERISIIKDIFLMKENNIKEKLKLLPEKPGCYLMKNSDGVIIYVGKAKILKNRVKSYFTGSHNAKTTLLVSEIDDFEYIITSNELESLVLEINLIKKYDPKYNIKLTDDKSYPYILLTHDKHPRLLVVRNNKIKGNMFGPYPNVKDARNTIDLLNKLYPLRKCNNIPKKECLYYHLNQCLAPCINDVKTEEYSDYLKKITRFLKGDTSEALNALKVKMNEYSESLRFEEAKECLDLINSINTTVEKQKIILNDNVDRDIFGYSCDDLDLSIYVLFMRGGKIVGNHRIILNIISTPLETFNEYLINFYEVNPKPKEILIPYDEDDSIMEEFLKVNIVTPKSGEKHNLVLMADNNAKEALDNSRELLMNKKSVKVDALNELKDLLGIKYPRRIEAFDNSNIMGTNPVSAMVCYIDGEKSPKDYRKYKVKTVSGMDDYATTKEIIYRRYFRLLMEDGQMPDLIIMDGGLGHLNAVLEIINSLNLSINVIGLRKDNNHKTEAIIYNNQEYEIKSRRNLYQLLFNIQEEVHRFAITFHKSVRSKGMMASKLDNIRGLGPKRKEKLLKEFKTIVNISNASLEDFKKLGLESIYEEVMNKLKQ